MTGQALGTLKLAEAQTVAEVLSLLEDECRAASAALGKTTVTVNMRRENVEEFCEILRRVL